MNRIPKHKHQSRCQQQLQPSHYVAGSDIISKYGGQCAIGTGQSSVTAGSACRQPQGLAQSCLLPCVEWGSPYLLRGATMMTRTNLHAQPGWLLLLLSSIDNRCQVTPVLWRRSPCKSSSPHFSRLEKCVPLRGHRERGSRPLICSLGGEKFASWFNYLFQLIFLLFFPTLLGFCFCLSTLLIFIYLYIPHLSFHNQNSWELSYSRSVNDYWQIISWFRKCKQWILSHSSKCLIILFLFWDCICYFTVFIYNYMLLN